MVSVAICIPTWKRPEFLGNLLRSLTALRRDGLAVSVIVVDNDSDGSARGVVGAFEGLLPALYYEVEPERGISAARNRLVAMASRLRADYVAFIDDDEVADPAWLANLVQTALDHGADAVGGPVLPHFDEDVSPWIRAGRFFDRPRYPTGTSQQLTRTGNLLVKCEWLARVEGPFDRRFDLTGGGDAFLLLRLSELGARMVWCDEALVWERVPTSRATVRWFLKRRFQVGLTVFRRPCLQDSRLRRRALQVLLAVVQLARGGGALALALFRGRVATVHALGLCAKGLGGLLGAAGYSYEAYRQIHGR